ncbi:MAG: phosphate ABC transporter substrate-binding protein PstS [Deltaproteobacteria bacterium]|nr:phosphate ABC transporter substrate-binding protein PstS [Candidatus Zymogenaceae bacterium]
MVKKILIPVVLLIAALLIAVPFFTRNEQLLGAGATFPHPLYSGMFSAYYRLTGVRINYEGIGSGGGIQQLLKKSIDFGGTEMPIEDESAGNIVHIPIAVGGVAVTYNLPENPPMRFSRSLITDIFLGRVTTWKDPAVVRDNPGVRLPDLPIIVVYRSDGSGTNALFTGYLSLVDPHFEKIVGTGLSVTWPVGVGAKGNAGVAGLVKNISGSIGYLELAYALTARLPVAAIENESGVFVEPTLASTEICADVPIPDDTRIVLVNTDEPSGYPISGFTWLILFGDLGEGGMSQKQARALVDLIWWMTHDGQRFCAPLQYAPLPADVVGKAERIIESITYEGRPVHR